MNIVNKLIYVLLFAAFLVFLISRLPDGTGFDTNVHTAFYNFGVYMHNSSYILPTDALIRVITWSMLTVGAAFTIRIFKFILRLLGGPGNV